MSGLVNSIRSDIRSSSLVIPSVEAVDAESIEIDAFVESLALSLTVASLHLVKYM